MQTMSYKIKQQGQQHLLLSLLLEMVRWRGGCGDAYGGPCVLTARLSCLAPLADFVSDISVEADHSLALQEWKDRPHRRGGTECGICIFGAPSLDSHWKKMPPTKIHHNNEQATAAIVTSCLNTI